MAHFVVVSFRLGGTDGVSIEAAKWISALRSMGHHVTTLAGDGSVDVLVPGLALDASTSLSLTSVTDVTESADVVIVENVASLPLNVVARDVLYEALEGRPAIFRHHDFAWQRDRFLDGDPPRQGAQWSHVTINDLSRRELAERGVESVVVRNSFDCDPPRGRRHDTRRALGIENERLLLFASRAIPRKNVEGALALAASLDATLWILGPAEDGYGSAFDELVRSSSVPVLRGLDENLTTDDAYAACDLVVMSSTWEGFGNPVLESVTHRRPLAVYPYPVLEEIRAFGFRFFGLGERHVISSFLDRPDRTLLETNLNIARRHFNLDDLPSRLSPILAARGVREVQLGSH